MRTLLKRLQAFVVFLITSIPTLAAASTSSSASVFDPTAIVNNTDNSITYLAELFGKVGSQLSSVGSENFIGHLFSIYNQGILVVAGVWIAYTLYDTLLKVSDKNGDQHMSGFGMKMFKVTLGVVLIIPSPTTGYSGAQDLAMFVVRQSVALADSTWSAALNYLQDGNMLSEAVAISSSSSSTTSLSTVATQSGYFGGSYSSTSSSIATLLNMLVCSINKNTWNSNSGTSLYTQSGTTFTMLGSGCGSVKVSDMTVSTSSIPTAEADSMKLNALTSLLSSLTNAATLYACNLNANAIAQGSTVSTYCSTVGSSSSTFTAASGQFNSQLATAFTDYVTNLLTIYDKANSSSNSMASQIETLTDTMKSGGWINAGGYYWAIAGWLQNNGDFGSIISNSTSAGLSAIKSSKINATAASTNYLNIGVLKYTSAVSCAGSSNCTSLSTQISEDSSALSSSGTSSDSLSISNDSSDILTEVIGGAIIDMYDSLFNNILSLSSTTVSGDPLVILTVIGFNLINEAATLIMVAFVLIIVLALIAILGVSFVVLIQALGFIQPILNFIIGILKSIAMYLILVGGVLAIYLPLYPWIVWTFAVVGWFITVIETMAAAPLVCAGLTRPSGQELAGNARQALIMLLGVFIRPVLMVVGFCSAIVLSRVVLNFVIHSFAIMSVSIFVNNSSDTSSIQTAISTLSTANFTQGYLTSVSDIVNNLSSTFSSATGNSGFGMFVFEIVAIPTVFAIIGYVAYKVVSISFSLVLHLPDYVVVWIGGSPGAISQSVQQAIEGSKGAAQAGLKEGSAVLSGGLGAGAAVSGAIANAASSKSENEKNEKEES